MFMWDWSLNTWTLGKCLRLSFEQNQAEGYSSLDQIYRRNGSVPIDLVGKVAEAVLRGLVYLYDVHRIIHRGQLPPTHEA